MVPQIVNKKEHEREEDIIHHHIEDYFSSLYSKEEQEWLLPSNLTFNSIGVDNASRLERPFEEVWHAVFDSGGEKAPGLDGFPVAFLQRFWNEIKKRMSSIS